MYRSLQAPYHRQWWYDKGCMRISSFFLYFHTTTTQDTQSILVIPIRASISLPEEASLTILPSPRKCLMAGVGMEQVNLYRSNPTPILFLYTPETNFKRIGDETDACFHRRPFSCWCF